jgi:F-type H+-transporting ATPase subunit b
MSRNRGVFFVASVLMVSLFAVAGAQAAEEGGNAAAARAAEIFKWINFAIVAGLAIWVFAKVLPPKFRAKAEEIGAAITKATNEKAAADAQLREAEAKLANLQKEVEEFRALAEREAAAEVERIHSATQADAQKIAAAAKAEIEAAERAARLELKALAAKLAVDGAETLLAKQLTAQTQAALISNFVKSLEGRPN